MSQSAPASSSTPSPPPTKKPRSSPPLVDAADAACKDTIFLELFAGSGGLTAKVAKVTPVLPPQDLLSEGIDFSDIATVEMWCDSLASQLNGKLVVFHVAPLVLPSLEPGTGAIAHDFGVRRSRAAGIAIQSPRSATRLPKNTAYVVNSLIARFDAAGS